MKRVFSILATLLLSAAAFAGPGAQDDHMIAVAPNSVGGIIVLTDFKGKCPPGPLSVLLSSNAQHEVKATGCWVLLGEEIVVRWDDDNTVDSLPATAFTFVKKS